LVIKLNPFSLAHPQAFAVRNAQDLATVGAKVNVASSESGPQFPYPNGTQLAGAMGTHGFDIFFGFEIYHIFSPVWPFGPITNVAQNAGFVK